VTNSKDLGKDIQTKLVETCLAILDVSGSLEYGGPHVQILRTSLRVCNPYVDAINRLRVQLLKELRKMGTEESDIKKVRQEALIVLINRICRF